VTAKYEYLHAAGSNVDISGRVRAYQTELRSDSHMGNAALSTLIVDDPDGGLDMKGLRQVTWSETSEGSNSQIIYRGFTADRTISRGKFRTQTGRTWNANLADQNSILTRRILRDATANRPAETDVARIQWLMTTSEMSSVITDSTYISTAEPVDMDAVDYRDQRVNDVIDDCAQQSGKDFFVIINEIPATPTFALFYDFQASTAYASTLRLSNVLSDIDNVTTFGVLHEATHLVRDPSRVYSGVVLPFDGGEVYVQDAAIANAFVSRDTQAPSVNVKTIAKATDRATRYIADAATEQDVVSTAVVLPLALVNHLKEGMTVNARFSHLPGYSVMNTMRVLTRTVTATSEENYTVSVELVNGPFTAAASAPAGIVQYKLDTDILQRFVTLDAKSTQGNLLVLFVTRRDAGEPNPAVTGWTQIAAAHNNLHWQRSCAIYYRVVTADESAVSGTGSPTDPATINKTYTLTGLSAGDTTAIMEIASPAAYEAGKTSEVNDAASSTAMTGGAVTPTAGAPCIIIMVAETYDNVTTVPLTGTTQLDRWWGGASPMYWVGYRIIASPSGSYTLGATLSGASLTSAVTAVFSTT